MPRAKEKKYASDARPAVTAGIHVKLVDALLNQLAVDEEEITRDARLVDDLGADAFDLVELQMALEEAFELREVSLDDADWERWELGTVTDVLDSLRRAGAKV